MSLMRHKRCSLINCKAAADHLPPFERVTQSRRYGCQHISRLRVSESAVHGLANRE